MASKLASRPQQPESTSVSVPLPRSGFAGPRRCTLPAQEKYVKHKCEDLQIRKRENICLKKGIARPASTQTADVLGGHITSAWFWREPASNRVEEKRV